MEAIIIKSIMAILFTPVISIIFVSMVLAICLSISIYIKVILTLLKDTYISFKHKKLKFIPKI